MARLIDAEKLVFREIDEIGGEYDPYYGCSKAQIDNAPTVDAIPRAQIDEMIKDIEKVSRMCDENDLKMLQAKAAYDHALDIIHRYTDKEQT